MITAINFRAHGLKINSNIIDSEIVRDRPFGRPLLYTVYVCTLSSERWRLRTVFSLFSVSEFFHFLLRAPVPFKCTSYNPYRSAIVCRPSDVCCCWNRPLQKWLMILLLVFSRPSLEIHKRARISLFIPCECTRSFITIRFRFALKI
jgi:hypothetical protein